MPRVTRSHTIRRHLVEGGLISFELTAAEQRAGCPSQHETDGFSVRQHRAEDGTLVVVAGAYGPNWLRTLGELCGRLESPHVKCAVRDQVPGLGDHEVTVRWATSVELQARKSAAALRAAPVVASLRRQEAEQRAAEERQALEDAGQSPLF